MKVFESFAAKADVYFPSSEELWIGSGSTFWVQTRGKLSPKLFSVSFLFFFFFLLSFFGCVDMIE